MTDFNQQLLSVCELAARAGARQLMALRERFEYREKGPADLVTDADVAAEHAIRHVIAEHYPDHAFVGEEQTAEPTTRGEDTYCWVVDPLDGTTNYVHGFPAYAVSVAVCRGTRLLAGVILDPLREECYRAARGGGAWLNGQRITTSVVSSLAEALVAISLPARVQRGSPDLEDFLSVVPLCRAVRRTGSAALNLAYVAAGRLDAFWAAQIHPWDVAAGALLVEEAGGTITNRSGRPFDLWRPKFLAASTPGLHAELLPLFRSGRPDQEE